MTLGLCGPGARRFYGDETRLVRYTPGPCQAVPPERSRSQSLMLR